MKPAGKGHWRSLQQLNVHGRTNTLSDGASVTTAMRKDLRELFSDPRASASCRLCKIYSHGSYLNLFCVVLVNLGS